DGTAPSAAKVGLPRMQLYTESQGDWEVDQAPRAYGRPVEAL
ncbi:hypothetical protein A2U01_0112696, partial [Trifolium medium]|nr:hypothetical protein [Trifolium medium]